MSRYVHKSHNVSVLLYHIVCPTKYRRSVITPQVDEVLRSVCLEISHRYEIDFLEIGADQNHVHFLVQSVPNLSPTRLVTLIKSLTVREIFSRVPEIKEWLWGGSFWSSGYFVNSVSRHGSEETVSRYVREQGVEQEYEQLHLGQLRLFDE